LSFVLLVTLLVGLFGAGSVLAQGTWNTGIDIQNLTGTAGTVAVAFYNADGSPAGTLNRAITAWGSLNFYLPSEASPPDGGQYSAVISSDVMVGATSSQANYTLGGSDIYLGTSQPEAKLNFPLVYRNHTSGLWNTKLVIQNASAAAQTVTLRLYSVGETTPDATDSATIPAYASHVFDISDAAYAAFGPYGSAVVEGSAALAGVADNIRNPGTRVNVIESSYRAFGNAQAGDEVILPLVYKNYNLWTTGVNLFNAGGIQTTVTITYTGTNIPGTWVDTVVLGPDAMGLFYTPSNANLPNGWYGSAVVTSSATDLYVVVASQRYRATGAEGVAYEGSLRSDATACVSLPVVHNRTSWKTGINILNLGNVNANVTINYASSAAGISNATQNIVVPANSPTTVYMPSDGTTALGFYGAADVKSTNGQLLLINAAHSRADQGVGANFVGINYTCP
jgi:hypothetical protein